MRWIASVLTAAVLSTGVASGCARQRVVRTEETVHVETQTPGSTSRSVERESRSSVVQEVRDDQPRGFFSGLVNAVGEVLALPFRAVGGLLRLIF
jgi:hypothetical protein